MDILNCIEKYESPNAYENLKELVCKLSYQVKYLFTIFEKCTKNGELNMIDIKDAENTGFSFEDYNEWEKEEIIMPKYLWN